MDDIKLFISLKYKILDGTYIDMNAYKSYPKEVREKWHKRCRSMKKHDAYASDDEFTACWIFYKQFLIEELYEWELNGKDQERTTTT